MCLGWKKHPWRVETMAEYNKPSGAVKKKEGRRIELGSVGRHGWSFGKRGSGII